MGREGTLEHGDGRSTLRSRDSDARPGTPRRWAAVVAYRLARLLEAASGESRRHRLHPLHHGHRRRRVMGWLVLATFAEPDRKSGAADAMEPEFHRLPSRRARPAGAARSIRSRGPEKGLPMGAWEQRGSGAGWRASRGGESLRGRVRFRRPPQPREVARVHRRGSRKPRGRSPAGTRPRGKARAQDGRMAEIAGSAGDSAMDAESGAIQRAMRDLRIRRDELAAAFHRRRGPRSRAERRYRRGAGVRHERQIQSTEPGALFGLRVPAL